MTTARYLVGDVFDRLADLDDDSVDLVLTSPPFLALRSYLPADHPHKGREIGSEDTPAAFIDTLLALTTEWDRVLAPHGSIAVELGDTYSGSGGSGGDYNAGGFREGQATWSGSAAKRRHDRGGQPPAAARPGRGHGRDRARAANVPAPSTLSRAQRDQIPGWPLAKSLTMIPELYRTALAYGINPLTGDESPAGRWRVRNVVRWHRPNPPVGDLGDKYRPATTDMVIACRARDRWFDLDAVRTPAPRTDNRRAESTDYTAPGQPDRKTRTVDDNGDRIYAHPGGAPPHDTWNISTAPYRGAHYATWPPDLCITPIESMCPREVCTTCCQPRRRITEPTPEHAERLGADMFSEAGRDRSERDATGRSRTDGRGNARITTSYRTIGWTDCGHNTWRRGVVLDPFAGTGTTLMVATGHGRDAIGIDLDDRNAHLAQERLGMFLAIEVPEAAA